MVLKKCALSLFLAFALLFPLVVPCFALSIDENAAVISVDILDTINRYKTNPDITYTVVEQKRLQGFCDETYTYYKLAPTGYAILLDSSRSLMEACYDADLYSTCREHADSTLYYGGPDILCTLTNGQYLDVSSNHIYTSGEINNI